jgi:spore maturation protein CgeB
MVTHPGNNYWLLKYLKPMVHYVPVNYDLSDLNEKIEWLVNNDAEAKKIAVNAMELARTVLSAEFQHGYLLKEIDRVASLYANIPA